MSNVKISALTSAGTLTGTEVLPIVQSGNTVKTTTQDIANLVPPASSVTIYNSNILITLGGSVSNSVRTNTIGIVNITTVGRNLSISSTSFTGNELFSIGIVSSNLQVSPFSVRLIYPVITSYAFPAYTIVFYDENSTSIDLRTEDFLTQLSIGILKS